MGKPRSKTFPYQARVHWFDTTTHQGWLDKPEEIKLAEVVTLGWVHRSTKVDLVIAQSRDIGADTLTYCNAKCIPRGCITKVERL